MHPDSHSDYMEGSVIILPLPQGGMEAHENLVYCPKSHSLAVRPRFKPVKSSSEPLAMGKFLKDKFLSHAHIFNSGNPANVPRTSETP